MINFHYPTRKKIDSVLLYFEPTTRYISRYMYLEENTNRDSVIDSTIV
jgi:hypothetical protein